MSEEDEELAKVTITFHCTIDTAQALMITYELLNTWGLAREDFDIDTVSGMTRQHYGKTYELLSYFFELLDERMKQQSRE